MGQETKTRVPTSSIDSSSASSSTETRCSSCDAVYTCVRGDASEAFRGYTSASREHRQYSSSSSRPGAICSTATPVPVLPAQPAPADASNVALASNAGGGSWKTFSPGKMPLGRLIGTSDLRDVAEHGLAGERVYLKGQFVVNFSDANKAVLRPRTKLTDKVLHFGGGSSTRIIVEFPAGYIPPRQGAEVSRDESRPYEITEVRKQEDGQLNVFVREIMQPN